jgi:hypothetical protein
MLHMLTRKLSSLGFSLVLPGKFCDGKIYMNASFSIVFYLALYISVSEKKVV